MWPRPDVAWDVLEKLGRVGAKILAIQAKTIDGLRVKARAACWALLGDLILAVIRRSTKVWRYRSFAISSASMTQVMEHPGALRKLVEDATNGATKSIAHQRDDIV